MPTFFLFIFFLYILNNYMCILAWRLGAEKECTNTILYLYREGDP